MLKQRILKVSLSFARLVADKLIVFGRNVVAMITANALLFPTPDPTAAAVTEALDDLAAKAAAARSGDKVAIADRNAARIVVLNLLRSLAAYVQKVSANDLSTLLSSGFEATKVPARRGIPAAPGNVRIDYNGKSGQLYLRFGRVAGVSSYMIQVATSLEGSWVTRNPVTSTRVTLDGFTPGTVYYIRVAAVGSAGTSAFGGPTTIMAV